MERRGLKEQELRDARTGVAEGGTAFQYTLRFLSQYNRNVKTGISGAEWLDYRGVAFAYRTCLRYGERNRH